MLEGFTEPWHGPLAVLPLTSRFNRTVPILERTPATIKMRMSSQAAIPRAVSTPP